MSIINYSNFNFLENILKTKQNKKTCEFNYNTNLIKKIVIELINKNKYSENKFKQIKNKIFFDFIKNKQPYDLIINLKNESKNIFNQVEIQDLDLIKNKVNFLNIFSFKKLYEIIIEEKIKLELKKINLKDYWDDKLFGQIENYKIKYNIIENNLVVNLNNNSVMIMCGTSQSDCYNGCDFIPSNIIYKSTNSSGTIINHNTKGKTNNVYNESNGVIVKNDIKLGLIKPDNKIVWKVANIKGTKTNCIIKLRLLETTKFIRPVDSEYIFRGKCRCDSAYVEEIQEYNFDNEIPLDNVIGIGIKGFEYQVGKIVYPDKWDNNINKSCTNGIHIVEKRENLKKFMEGISFYLDEIIDNLSDY